MPALRILSLLFMTACASALADPAAGHEFTVHQSRELSLAQYRSELDHLSALANQAGEKPDAADEAIIELRGGWIVVANGQRFTVSGDAISKEFEPLRKGASREARERLIQRLQALKSDAVAFEEAPVDPAPARAALDGILERGEFRHVHGPGLLDRLKYRILTWIVRLLAGVFGSSSVPTVGRILVWVLVSAAVVVLARFAYRTIRHSARLESIVPQLAPESAKRWPSWMVEAQEAAAQGLWRDAVHFAYWAGISFLEENGMWKPNPTRTPREYLSLLPAASEYRATLSALTRQLELTWYGNQPAGRETFSETLTLLEKLGCRPA